MLVDDERKNFWGHLKGPTTGASILIVVAVIEEQLVEFSHQYAGSTITNEKGLNQELCIMLNSYVTRKGYPFWFEKDYMEEPGKGDSPQPDFGVLSNLPDPVVINSKCHSNGKSFFSAEAKRLDTISRQREKGKSIGCGGVERFKKEIHGKNLKYAAIIGYVQKYDFNYWHHTINAWINELVNGSIFSSVKWSVNDRLVEEYKRPHTAKFQSENSRKKDNIFLFHLWVNLVRI